MSFLRHGSLAIAFLTAAAACAGCANQASPVTPTNSTLQNAAKGGALLYVSDIVAGSVSFYGYPGLELKGEISGFKYPGPLCTDPRNGNVWVVSGSLPYKLSQFAHGAIHAARTLKLDIPELTGCAVNPKNGDVALTQFTQYDDAGSLRILTHGTDNLKFYQNSDMFFYAFVAYDAHGNAFVDGVNSSGQTQLDELPDGGNKLEDVTPYDWTLRAPNEGGVQYDGTDVVVGQLKHGRLYRIADRHVVGTSRLYDTCLVRQFAIDGNTLIAPNACHAHGDVLLYNYPSSFRPTARIAGFRAPYAVAISR